MGRTVLLKEIISEYSKRNKALNDYPVYSVTNSQGFCKDYFGKEVASKDKSTYKVVPYGCFAYNPSRINVGSIDWQHCEENVIVSPLYNVFSVDSSKIKQEFLLYYFRSETVSIYINSLAKGTVRMNLSLKALGEFPINLPSLDEQEKIVSELDNLRSIISKQKEQSKDLNTLALSIFHKMFGDIGDRVPLSYYVSSFEGGKSLAGQEECKNKVLKTGAVTYDYFRPYEVKNLPLDYSPQESDKVRIGDLLISRMNTPDLVGACAYVWGVGCNTYLPDRLWRVGLKDNVNPIFLWQAIIQDETKEQIRKLASGSSGTMKNISKPKLMSVLVPSVPFSLQVLFAEQISAIEHNKANIAESVRELDYLFSSRLSFYFD